MNYDYRVKDRDYFECSGTARMWFRLHPFEPSWPHQLRGIYHADAIDYRVRVLGCTDVPDPHRVCTAPGQPETRGRMEIGPVGRFGVDMLGAPGGTFSFIPLVPELSFLTLADEIRHDNTTPLTCVDLGPGGGQGTSEWSLPVIGDIRPWSHEECDNPLRHSACTPATMCQGATGDQHRDCLLHPERYAVIPFEGSERVVTSTGGVDVTIGYRWEVCCGCGEPPSGPPPEMSQDPCGDLGIQRGQMQVAVDTSALLRRRLKPHRVAYDRAKQQASQYRPDFDFVARSCAGWDIAVMLTQALFGGVGAAEGLGPTEGAQAFSKLMSLVEGVLEQDPTLPLTMFLSAAEELEVAGETALEVKLLGIEGWTASGVIDTVGTVTDGALEFLSRDEIQTQRDRLEDCTDTPLVAGITFDDARRYLDYAEEAARELSEILPLMTRIEQSDTAIYNAWHAYHRACLDYAACTGRDPAVCNPPPP